MEMKGKAIRNTKIDNVILRFLTPLPKTRLYEKLEKEGKLTCTSFPEDWIYYNLATITYRSEFGSASEFFNAYRKTLGLMFAPFGGLIKNYYIRRFFCTIIHVKSIKIAIDAHIFLAFCIVGEYKSKFWRVLFRLYKPKINFNM